MRCLLAAYDIDIRDLDLISPENRDDLRRWMCSRAGPREPPMSLPDILWRAAQTRADAGAIEASDGSWTYRDLADACYSLFHHLREAGVESGDMVLLLREKSNGPSRV
jgi:non-ribosomal peptide synthetase component F